MEAVVSNAPRTRLRDRDIEALAFIGRGYEVAQYQLHEAVFAFRAPNVVSRFVTRAAARGFLAAARLGGTGINRLRLTRCGREFLVTRGSTGDELFAPMRPVAPKDLAHTLAIGDLLVALGTLKKRPDVVRPAWYLQRTVSSTTAIPDVLARWKGHNGTGLLLAYEIDLGAERLTSVFLPKLDRLAAAFAGDEHLRAGIVIFTRGNRRLELLCAYAREATIPVMPFLLPETTGSREGIGALRSLLAFG